MRGRLELESQSERAFWEQHVYCSKRAIMGGLNSPMFKVLVAWEFKRIDGRGLDHCLWVLSRILESSHTVLQLTHVAG
jgi:hypothetical protein